MSDSTTPPFESGTPAPNSTLSLTSLIMGILGWFFIPVVGAIIAVITGHLAKKEIKESDGALGGDTMATIGLVLGYSHLALILCICLLAIILVPAFFAGVWTFGN